MNADDAADAFSETLMTIWRRLDDVPSQNPLPWCYGVARRVASNHRRARKRHLQLVERLEREPSPAPSVDFADPELQTNLAALSASDRMLLHFLVCEGLQPRDLPTVTGLS